MAEIYLRNVGEKTVSVSTVFILRDTDGAVHHEDGHDFVSTLKYDDEVGASLVSRSEILDKKSNILLDGALLVDVHLQFQPDSKSFHVPPCPLGKNQLAFLESEESADVAFIVEGKTIHAHTLILQMNAPILYNICEGKVKGESIAIEGISLGMFRLILRYIYGGEVPRHGIFCSDKMIDIIDAANRFGLESLKLTVENTMVESLVIDTEDEFVDFLLFADSKTCPLLKEYAISYFVARAQDIMQSDSWKKLDKCIELKEELMVEMSKCTQKRDARFNNTPKSMGIDCLRKNLAKRKLDIDGSKEMLISRLQESNKKPKPQQ